MPRWLSGTLAVLALCGAVACVHRAERRSPYAPVEYKRSIVLYEHGLDVHLARPAQWQPDAPLLLYATGDGGWRGRDREAFRRMIRWGYPVAGFSAPSYLSHLGFISGTTTPARLAHDYQTLIEFARDALSLPAATRTILVGVSRGAGLAVVAAGRREIHAELAGVLAVALTREEEYVQHYRRRRGQAPGDRPSSELVVFQTYEYLDRLRSIPLAVIQSTGDDYLPAADARRLFGADTDLRKLFAIDAPDHGFTGAREALYDRMASSLAWICKVQPAEGQ